MMASSNGNTFRVTGPLCGEFTGHLWIPLTKASDVELWCCLWSAPWINGWVNNLEAGDLRRHHAHYDGIVMQCQYSTAIANVEHFKLKTENPLIGELCGFYFYYQGWGDRVIKRHYNSSSRPLVWCSFYWTLMQAIHFKQEWCGLLSFPRDLTSCTKMQPLQSSRGPIILRKQKQPRKEVNAITSI